MKDNDNEREKVCVCVFTVNKCMHIKFVHMLCMCVWLCPRLRSSVCVSVPSLRVCYMLISSGVSVSLRAGAGCYKDSSVSLLPLPCCQARGSSHFNKLPSTHSLTHSSFTPSSSALISCSHFQTFLSWKTLLWFLFYHLEVDSGVAARGSRTRWGGLFSHRGVTESR